MTGDSVLTIGKAPTLRFYPEEGGWYIEGAPGTGPHTMVLENKHVVVLRSIWYDDAATHIFIRPRRLGKHHIIAIYVGDIP